MSNNSAGQRGSALLAVMWLAAALAAIAFAVASTVRAETDRVSTAADGVRAHFLASGSVDRAILWIWWGYQGHSNPDGSPRFYRAPMPVLRFPYPSGEAVVEIMPETAKLNVNEANPNDLMRLLRAVGATPERAAEITGAILDWRTPSPLPTVFDSFYLSRNPSFRARHASLEEIEELLLVKGMTPELFHGSYREDEQGRLLPAGGLKDCLSIHGSTTTFDINTADPTLLLSLGISPGSVNAIVRRRLVLPFRNDGEALAAAEGIPRVRVGGNTIWTLRATARLRLANGQLSDISRSVAATVKFLDPNEWNPPYHILRWYEDGWSQSALTPVGPPPTAGGAR